MMFKDWPRGAALWWRRIPTATSGRAVRESDRMLLGSAHAVPMHVGFSWNGWLKMCIHVPSGTALQEPAGGGPRTRREHRRGTRTSPPTQRRWRRHAAAAASLGRKVAQTPPRRKGSQKCWRRIPTETRERSVRESDWFVSSRADLKLWQRRILIETFESAQQCIQI